MFTAGGAVLLALVLGLGLATWMFAREHQAHQRAAAAEQEQGRLRVVAQAAQAAAEDNASQAKALAIQSRRGQYAADMFAATLEIERANYGTARSLLREFFPREGQEELRGFEWRYYWQLSAGQQLKMFQFAGKVMDMAWSPDGRLIAEGNSDQTVKLVRPDTGEVASVLTGHTGRVVSVAFSYDGNEPGHRRARTLRPGRMWFASGMCRMVWLVFTLAPYAQTEGGLLAGWPVMAVGTGGDWWGEGGGGRSPRWIRTSGRGKLRKCCRNLKHDRAFFSPDGTAIRHPPIAGRGRI